MKKNSAKLIIANIIRDISIALIAAFTASDVITHNKYGFSLGYIIIGLAILGISSAYIIKISNQK